MTKNTEKKTNNLNYSFYSRVLEKPFESLSELSAAEAKHFEALKAKEAAAAQKKTDALKVEAAFKALNAARKEYKEKLTQLTAEYAESLDNLKKAYELGKKDITNKLAEAEADFSAAHKEFTDKYENYHMTLKDGDFETTFSKQTSGDAKTSVDFSKLADIFDLLFKF
jgi:chromosome segregation ATPase